MSVTTIENLTDKPIWLPLNSGQSLNIMPHASREVPQGEVRGNAKLRQLHDGRLIRTTPPYGEAREGGDEDDERDSGRRGSRRKS